MKNLGFIPAIGFSLIVSGCGGGGGSGTSVTTPVGTTLSTITAANSNTAASNGYAASTALSDSSSSLTNVVTGVSIGGTHVSTVAPVLKLVRHAGSAPGLLTGATVSSNCTGGGTVSIDATLRNAQTISNGDTMTITANNCTEDGVTMNGVMSVAFSDMSGDILNTFTFGATMDTRFTNFSVVSGADTVGINGDMKLTISQANAANATLSISGKSLQAIEKHAGANAANRTLTDYLVTGSTHGTTITATASFGLSGNTSSLGQFAYSVKTVQPFVWNGTVVPGTGSMLVTGAASSVTITVVDTSSVRLDYSAKGDGTVSQSTTLSWTDFLAAS